MGTADLHTQDELIAQGRYSNLYRSLLVSSVTMPIITTPNTAIPITITPITTVPITTVPMNTILVTTDYNCTGYYYTGYYYTDEILLYLLLLNLPEIERREAYCMVDTRRAPTGDQEGGDGLTVLSVRRYQVCWAPTYYVGREEWCVLSRAESVCTHNLLPLRARACVYSQRAVTMIAHL